MITLGSPEFWLTYWLAAVTSVVVGVSLGLAIAVGGTWIDVQVRRRRRMEENHE